MTEDKKAEGFYQIRAKEFVDVLFNREFFREDVSRDGLQAVEDYLALNFQQQCESSIRCALFTKKFKEKINDQ